MKKYFTIILLLASVLIQHSGCKKQLDVGNPNAPTISGNVNSEAGIISLATGAVYVNGFTGYFDLPWGYQELMADIVGADIANNQVSAIGLPDYVVVNGTRISNTTTSIGILRTYNNRPSTGAGNNAFYFQWAKMYELNNALNKVLQLVDNINFSGDASTKKNTIKAWCYWWKGYAYASIGSMYYSGLIIDNVAGSNVYVSHDAIINQSNIYLNKAASTIGSITNNTDYNIILGQLIPAFCQVGKGGILTTDMWRRNINTMLARNILVNKLSPFVNGNLNAVIIKSSAGLITNADWNNILTLTANGIRSGDFVFTGRSPAINGFYSSGDGTVSSLTLPVNTVSVFKISERFIQNFKPGDLRLSNNFDQSSTYTNSFVYSTRFSMIDGGIGIPGVYIYGTQVPDNYEVIIAGSYEENALMAAEANIRLGNINAGLINIDAVRNYFGTGLSTVAGTGLTQAVAMRELVQERRVSLVFRGLSFYDSRRWGWSYDISNGGGSYGNNLLLSTGSLKTNVTFNYNFLDYWDVPADETILNPPSSNSVPVKNPNF